LAGNPAWTEPGSADRTEGRRNGLPENWFPWKISRNALI
jgi:hypothetical protein